ncbi:hypothetical protein IV417_02300 [Alphaproteobacteria bacterium KMM 3653]|uniref:SARP family transcriptional regulator n=1 Tax=Harenicola maris TaxID=2841044 RepID=A0AAP2CMD1_9RHOB|nr:hypothetical protein [Harenicola maris]
MCVRDAEGTDVTPRGARARALIAILALSRNMTRSRRWIESTLWSSRDPKQAGASLRQTLSEIRRSFGEAKGVLLADRSSVSFDTSAVFVDLLEGRADAATGEELLEGLEINDPAYSEWLRSVRSACRPEAAPLVAQTPMSGMEAEAQSPAQPAPSEVAAQQARLIVAPDTSGNRTEDAIAHALGRQIARSVLDHVPVEISVASNMPKLSHRAATSDICLAPLVLDHGKTSMVSVELSDSPQGNLLWSEALTLDVSGPPILTAPDVIASANEAAEQIARQVVLINSGEGTLDQSLAKLDLGITETFSMEADRMRRADGLFAAVEDPRAKGLAAAWRSLLATMQVVERTAPDPVLRRAEAEAYLIEAMEVRPANATVLAVASQIINLLALPGYDALAMAQAAVRLSRWNPMAKLALGLAQMRKGDIVEAHRTIEMSRAYASRLRNKHWWDMCYSLAALATGRIDDAISAAESALVFHPQFRPPMRHLYALYLHKGRMEDAEAMLTRMRAVEPDFSLRMMRQDPSYPAATIRRTTLISQSDIAAV